MTKKIFKSNILVAVVVLIFGIACVMAILYQHFGKQIDTELKKEATYLAYGVEQNGVDYLNQIKEKDDRITYIAEDGKVLYDNQADASSMENHSDRKEVQEALKSGSGRAERDSKTLSQKTIYYALRLSDNTVLRVSSTQYSVWVLLMEMVPPMIGIAVVMLILAGLVSMHMANKIVEPINNVDLEHPEENQIYEEVGPLLSKIYKQNGQIRSQLEAARRNQEEFTIITENMQEGLLVIDSYTKILSQNTSVRKMIHMQKPNIGECVYLLNRGEEFRLMIEQVLRGEHGSVRLRLGGEVVQMIANPVTREQRVVGAVLLLINETEKVEREQLRREFSANVSHELMTPLTAVSGFAEIIRNGMVRQEDVQKFAGRIYDEAQRLIALIEDTIRVSQLDEGETPYDWEELDVYQIVRDVCSRLKEIADKKNVHFYIDGDKTMLYSVRPILDEIIYNLCDNGIKYNREDGTVSIHLQ